MKIKKPLRILYFAFVELDIPNAPQTHTLGVLSGFCKNGCKIDAIIPRPKKIVPNIDGVNFFYIWPWGFSGLNKLWAKCLGGFYLFLLCFLKKFDFIYVRELKKNPFPRWCAKIFGIPLYFEINGLFILDQELSKRKRNDTKRLEKNQRLDFQCADGLIVPSFPRSRWIIKKYGIHPKKVYATLNGATIPDKMEVGRSAALKRLNLSADGFFLGFLGTVWRHYDLKSIIRAMRLCKAQVPKISLIIIGGGPGMQEIKEQANNEGILCRIIDLGFIQPNELFKVIKAIDLGLMVLTKAGLKDLGPITTRFATYASYGIPVIGNTLYLENYPQEIIQALYKVPHENPHALSDKIINIYRSPKDRYERAKNLQNYAARKLTWNAVTTDILEVICKNKIVNSNYK